MTGRRFNILLLQAGVGSLITLCLALSAGFVYSGSLQRDAERLLAESLQARGQVGMSSINSRLLETWETANRLAKSIDVNNPKEVRHELALLRQVESRWLWLGIADLEGRIVIATDVNIEGDRASEMPWFRRGLINPSGDQLDTGLFPSQSQHLDDEANRSIIMSTPLRDSDSKVNGVLAMQVSWRWLTEQIASVAVGNIETLLVARDNSVIFGPAALMGKHLETDVSAATDPTKSTARIEHWSDGQDYMTMTVASSAFRGLPNFGWRIVLRQDLKAALAPTRELARQFWMVLIATTALALIILFLETVWLIQPLRRLVRFGKELTQERTAEIPREEIRYEEAAQLSAILCTLQLSLMAAKARELRSTSSDQPHAMRLVPFPDRGSS